MVFSISIIVNKELSSIKHSREEKNHRYRKIHLNKNKNKINCNQFLIEEWNHSVNIFRILLQMITKSNKEILKTIEDIEKNQPNNKNLIRYSSKKNISQYNAIIRELYDEVNKGTENFKTTVKIVKKVLKLKNSISPPLEKTPRFQKREPNPNYGKSLPFTNKGGAEDEFELIVQLVHKQALEYLLNELTYLNKIAKEFFGDRFVDKCKKFTIEKLCNLENIRKDIRRLAGSIDAKSMSIINSKKMEINDIEEQINKKFLSDSREKHKTIKDAKVKKLADKGRPKIKLPYLKEITKQKKEKQEINNTYYEDQNNENDDDEQKPIIPNNTNIAHANSSKTNEIPELSQLNANNKTTAISQSQRLNNKHESHFNNERAPQAIKTDPRQGDASNPEVREHNKNIENNAGSKSDNNKSNTNNIESSLIRHSYPEQKSIDTGKNSNPATLKKNSHDDAELVDQKDHNKKQSSAIKVKLQSTQDKKVKRDNNENIVKHAGNESDNNKSNTNNIKNSLIRDAYAKQKSIDPGKNSNPATLKKNSNDNAESVDQKDDNKKRKSMLKEKLSIIKKIIVTACTKQKREVVARYADFLMKFMKVENVEHNLKFFTIDLMHLVLSERHTRNRNHITKSAQHILKQLNNTCVQCRPLREVIDKVIDSKNTILTSKNLKHFASESQDQNTHTDYFSKSGTKNVFYQCYFSDNRYKADRIDILIGHNACGKTLINS